MMEVRIETRGDLDVVYTFKLGPYNRSAPTAWETLGEWIHLRNLETKITDVIGFGLDSPCTTPPPLIRYVAAFALSEDMEPDEGANVHVMTVPGGAYAVHTMIGPYDQMPKLFERFQEEWIPQSGRQIDFMRPFLEIYTKKMGEVPEEALETDICIPLLDEAGGD